MNMKRDFTEEKYSVESLFLISGGNMEPSFIYEAKGQTLIIHMPKELDHYSSRNLRYETDLLMAEN